MPIFFSLAFESEGDINHKVCDTTAKHNYIISLSIQLYTVILSDEARVLERLACGRTRPRSG